MAAATALPPRRATRLEQARALDGHADTHALATAANAHVFGPGEPTAGDAQAYWSSTNLARSRLRSDADLWRRLRADLDLRPLFAGARPRPGPGRATRTLLPTRRATAS